MSGRSILVTGATGGLGKALVQEALERGHRVRASGRSTAAGEALTALGASFAPCDLEHPKADLKALVQGCDSVIHAAALSASWGPRAAFVSANVEATEALLAAAREAGMRRFVFVSSPSIYARLHHQPDLTEDDPPNPKPLNWYAQTKRDAEQAVLAQSDEILACCAIRPRALVGPGDRVILPRLADLASRQRLPLPGGGRALIELTDLRDAAWAICEAEERAQTLSGRAINISGGQPVEVRAVARAVAQALGKEPRLVPLPLGLARVLAEAMERVAKAAGAKAEPLLTRYSLATLGFSQSFDLTRAHSDLGYSPRHDALQTLCEQARTLAGQGGNP